MKVKSEKLLRVFDWIIRNAFNIVAAIAIVLGAVTIVIACTINSHVAVREKIIIGFKETYYCKTHTLTTERLDMELDDCSWLIIWHPTNIQIIKIGDTK